MKYITIFLAILATVISVCFVSVSPTTNALSRDAYLRIHVRANSNSEEDQNIKYQVKDDLVSYLTPLVCNAADKTELFSILDGQRNEMKKIADTILKDNGFSYASNVKIDNELFPTRTYNGYTLESGFYDAIIVELGTALGDNWWCVVYPPLCFLNVENHYGGQVVYKSKLWEIINQFFNGE